MQTNTNTIHTITGEVSTSDGVHLAWLIKKTATAVTIE